MDPVEIVADKLLDAAIERESLHVTHRQLHRPLDLADARAALNALHAAGWRVVRTEDTEHPGEDVQIIEECTP